MKKHFLILVALPLLFACSVKEEHGICGDASAVEEQVPSGIQSGMIRVKFREEPVPTKSGGLDLQALGNFTMTRTFPPAGKWEARHRAAGLHLWYDICFDKSLPVTKAERAVLGQANVEVVELVPIPQAREIEYPFNDPRLPSQWHYQNFGGSAQLAEGCDVNAFNAWTIETGRPEVIVAINDSGVDYTHEDLAANIWINEAELNGKPGEDDDNNGYADDIYGYSFITYDGKVPVGKIDFGRHGTHVAGTVGAVNNNGIGVSGVAGGNGTPSSGIRLMVTQTLDEKGNGALTPQSFVYAADNGAVLVNCSWGFVNNENPTPQSYVKAIDYFNEYAGMDENGEQVGPMAGGLVIFAAGNDGREIEHPAMDENVFAVAALSANYVRSYFTSFGEWVDISAPGGDANRGTYVLSTLPGNQYGNMQGSSMACPHATGVAALIVSYYGAGKKGFTREKLIHLMQSTANKRALEENGSYATRLGAGLIDAYAALKAEGDTQKPLPVSTFKGAAQANAISLSWIIPGSEEVKAPYAFNIFYGTSSLASLDPSKDLPEGVEKVKVLSYGRQAGEELTHILESLKFDANYHLRIQSESLTGLTSALSSEITVQTGHNNPPVITPLDGTSITLRSFETGELRFAISDADGHPMTVEVTKDLPGFSMQAGSDQITLTINALKAGVGTQNGVLTVSDGYTSTKQSFSYTVKANTAPAVRNRFEDQVFDSKGETRSFELASFFTDADEEPLEYSVSSSSTSIIVNPTVEGGKLTLQAHSLGQTTLTVLAKDASGESASQSFRVLVRDGSSPLEVYPNPVKDNLYIRTAQASEVKVKLVSTLGAVVYEGSLQSSPFEPASIDCSDYPSGVYTLVAEAGGQSYKKTVVKQ